MTVKENPLVVAVERVTHQDIPAIDQYFEDDNGGFDYISKKRFGKHTASFML